MTDTPVMEPGTALLPCPFCGGEAAVESPTCGYRVQCVEDGCYTAGPWPDDCTEAEAITAWNTRTPDPAPSLLEALENAIDEIESGRLYEPMCCNGRDCGCQGSDNASFLVWNLRQVLSLARSDDALAKGER